MQRQINSTMYVPANMTAEAEEDLKWEGARGLRGRGERWKDESKSKSKASGKDSAGKLL